MHILTKQNPLIAKNATIEPQKVTDKQHTINHNVHATVYNN